MRYLPCALLLVAIGCDATIPQGKLVCTRDSDCPPDWHCVADQTAGHCFASNAPVPKNDAGSVRGADAGADSGTGGRMPGLTVPKEATGGSGAPLAGTLVEPSSATFSTLGGRRGDQMITVYDDGFEVGDRACTPDGHFCMTGGFQP
jgi:hypothetical protein